MFLLVAATDMEMQPLKVVFSTSSSIAMVVSGVGPVESAYTVTRYLEKNHAALQGVINFGVAGAYPDSKAMMLDICMAEREIFGDFGVCMNDAVTGFEGSDLSIQKDMDLLNSFRYECEKILKKKAIEIASGNFVTVSCASGTSDRGLKLMNMYDGMCENMEGFGVARACHGFDLPFVEIRCVSNMVEDRNRESWKFEEARDKCAQTIVTLLADLV